MVVIMQRFLAVKLTTNTHVIYAGAHVAVLLVRTYKSCGSSISPSYIVLEPLWPKAAQANFILFWDVSPDPVK
ncbi:hypothetical protein D9619_006351 [Psilocybe cf. subviscida]|uniref:Uncharacterized protein n=1 Tax=Psilocybe cf. subviscida TaxID=2480587 RepID=A0A8H5EXV7_9AGAR|nr:hypothetical protein D9619_006351 [Psilocybe cf. subviscida]